MVDYMSLMWILFRHLDSIVKKWLDEFAIP
jgi:hypothetical protein